MSQVEQLDVLIVGAGISGIDAGYHLQKLCPDKTYAIVEARDNVGGTWDLFRYPGIRSDSDMYTMGYAFKPWNRAQIIAPGGDILDYLAETAREFGIDRHIRFGHRVIKAEWKSVDSRWHVSVERSDGETLLIECGFVHMCCGYYDYAKGYVPEFEGYDTYTGQVIHPQHWPQDADWTGKNVVVIGSGATAATVVPAMAEKAASVTMLQRSPTYFVSRPNVLPLAQNLARVLPQRAVSFLMRWKHILQQQFFYWYCQRFPQRSAEKLIEGVRGELGADYDVDTHFTPRYSPWDQRLCLVPDSDFFVAMREGKANVVTDHIECFTPAGLKLESGRELEADIVVMATGLELNFLGNIDISVDGVGYVPHDSLTFKGMLVSGLPNLAFSFGYTNASWTLKADLTSAYVCRLLKFMDRHGYKECRPRDYDDSMEREDYVDFSSGYFMRARDRLPGQGKAYPWKLYQNYLVDIISLRFRSVADPDLRFS